MLRSCVARERLSVSGTRETTCGALVCEIRPHGRRRDFERHGLTAAVGFELTFEIPLYLSWLCSW
jgi:hypothetical protein